MTGWKAIFRLSLHFCCLSSISRLFGDKSVNGKSSAQPTETVVQYKGKDYFKRGPKTQFESLKMKRTTMLESIIHK